MKCFNVALSFFLLLVLPAATFAQDSTQELSVDKHMVVSLTGNNEVAEQKDESADSNLRRRLQFENVCCSQCVRFDGNAQLQCYGRCQTVCYTEDACVNSGHGAYAAWCLRACSTVGLLPGAAYGTTLTPTQCEGACAGQVQSWCYWRHCNDVVPNCNANFNICVAGATPNCALA